MLQSIERRFADLAGILEPRAVVVVGASERAGNLGGETVRRLVKFPFPGRVMAINRSGEAVHGISASPDFRSLPETPDLAIFAIPAEGMAQAVAEAIEAGIRSGVAFAGGFTEVGGDGVTRQAELTEICRRAGFVLCGPNCVGTINSGLPLTATFASALHELDTLHRGNVSIVSQSGGIATTVLSQMEAMGFGLRHMVSCGNEAVVNLADYLYAFAQDEGTRVIAAYLEGIRDGERLAEALAEAQRRGKSVVLIKAGATGASARAAQAHTGALVGEDRVFQAVLREYGVIRVFSVEEMIDAVLLLSTTPAATTIAGGGVGLVTFGGGNGVLGSDQCEQAGLEVPQITPEGVAGLQPLLVSVASAANPLDLTPSTAFRPEALAKLPEVLDVFAAQPEIDAVLFIVGTMASKAAEISQVFTEYQRRCPKPVLLSWPGPPAGLAARFAADGIFSYDDPARPIRALGRIVAGHRALLRTEAEPLTDFDWQAFVPEGGAAVVTEDRCHALLKAAGLGTAPGGLAHSAAEAVAIATDLGFPVVLKGIGPKVTHRAAAGLLAVGVADGKAAADAWGRLDGKARQAGTPLDGIYVQKMLDRQHEVLVSAMRDRDFGVIVTVGAGGGLTELLDDVMVARAPVDAATAAAMLRRLRMRKLLDDAAIAGAAEYVSRFSALAAGAPWERFIFEVNPILAGPGTATAVDGLLIIED